MSDEKQRLVEACLDAWLADVETVRHLFDAPDHPDHRFSVALTHAITMVRHARTAGDPQLLLFSVILLARVVATVQGDSLGRLFAEYERIVDEMIAAAHLLGNVALPLADADTARESALAAGRKTRREKQEAKREQLRVEFERLRQGGLSARRAAEILSGSSDFSAEAIRKLFRF